MVRADLCDMYQKMFHYLKTNEATYRFMSYNWVRNGLGLLTPPLVPTCCSSSTSFHRTHGILVAQVYVPRHINSASEKKLVFSHSFKCITSEIGIKMCLIISDHSLMSWPYLSVNNSFPSTKIQKKKGQQQKGDLGVEQKIWKRNTFCLFI